MEEVGEHGGPKRVGEVLVAAAGVAQLLPALPVLVDAPAGEPARRWAGLCEGADRLGIVVVFLGDTSACTGRVVTDVTHIVRDAEPERLARMVVGAELFAVGAAEAAERLGSFLAASSEVADSAGADPAGGGDGARAYLVDGLAEVVPSGGTDGTPPLSAQAAVPGPVAGPDARLRPIRVEILGLSRRVRLGGLGPIAQPGEDAPRQVPVPARRGEQPARRSTPFGPTPHPRGCSSSSGALGDLRAPVRGRRR